MDEFRKTGYERGPAGDPEDWYYHAGDDAAVHAEEIGELRVSFHVAGSDLFSVSVGTFVLELLRIKTRMIALLFTSLEEEPLPPDCRDISLN